MKRSCSVRLRVIKAAKIRVSLKEYRPDLLNEWNYKRNKDYNPSEIYYGSNTKVWWICKNKHEWKNEVSYRSRGFGKCKQCKGLKFKNPEIWKELHPTLNNEFFKNRELSEYTLATSQLKVWWLGKICKHTWDMDIRARVKNKQNCPYCSNQRVLKGYNDLATTRSDLLKYWDIRNKIKPTEITYGSKKHKIIWTNKCGHTWLATPNHRIKVKNDYCPKCLLLINYHPWLVKYFDKKLNPEINFHSLNKGSETKITWHKKECNHTWIQKVLVITTYADGYCKICTMYRSKGELELSNFISQITPKSIKIYNNHRFLLNNNKEVDIYIPELNLAIEYNGEYYHSDYHQESSRINYLSFPTRHKNKLIECSKKNITLLYVWESDWNESKDLVKSELNKIVSKAVGKQVLHNEIPDIFKRLVSTFDM